MTLLAHAPLQKSLTVTTYSSQPDANGIHNVASTATLNTTMTSDTYESVNVLTPQETRISDVFAFKLDKTKNVNNTSMPSDANIISFWGYVGSSWNLYIRFAGNMYKNDQILFSYDDFTLTYAGTNFGITANKDTYIADIRFHKIDDVSSGISAIYAMLNKHPKTPSFGFYQLAHSSNIGIVGNQLDDSLVAFKKGSDDTSFHLADIQCNEIHSKTIDDLKNGLQNINLSYDANGTDVNLQYLYENKLNSTDPVFSGSLTGPELKIGTQPQTGDFIHGSLQAGNSTLSSLKITGSLTDGSTLSTTLQALANKADSYTDDSNVPVTLQSLHNNKLDISHLTYNDSSISNIKEELDKKSPFIKIGEDIIDCGFLYYNKLDKADPTFSGTLTGPELKIGSLSDSTFNHGTLSAGTISSTIISNDGTTTKTHTLHDKAEAYSYDDYDDSGNTIKVPVTLETLHNDLSSTANALTSIQSTIISNSQPTLASHLPLQSNLSGVQSGQPFIASATSSSPTFIDVSDIHTRDLSPDTLHVSNIDATYNGTYTSILSFSVKQFIDNGGIVKPMNFDQNYPIFQHTSNSNIYFCFPQTGGTWTFFTCNSLPATSGFLGTTSFLDTRSSYDTTTFNHFTYPVLQGTFSHNFDIDRIRDINCLQLDSGDSLSFPKESDDLSFWAWSPNAPSWSLYTADNTTGSWSIKRNNIAYDGSDISLTTSNSNISIKNTSSSTDTLQFPPPPRTHSNVNFDGYRTTSFDVSGSSYGNGTYSVVTNYSLSEGLSPQGGYHLFDDVVSYDNNLHSNENPPLDVFEITIKVPYRILLQRYEIFPRAEGEQKKWLPDTWKVEARSQDGTWTVIDDITTSQSSSLSSSGGIYTIGDSNNTFSDTFRFGIKLLEDVPEYLIISELRLFAKEAHAYITDIKQYSQSVSDYDDINFHPLNPTFGFSLPGHSADVGISGNQLGDAMRITKGDSLGDLEVNDAIVKGNVIADSVHASSIVADDLLCSRIQPYIPKTFLACSSGYSNGFIDTQGNTHVIGNNSSYQLGIGHNKKVSKWEKLPQKFVTGSISETASIMIDSDGNAWGSGHASYGELGLNLPTWSDSQEHVYIKTHAKITKYCLDYNDGSLDVKDIKTHNPDHKWVSAALQKNTSFLLDADGNAWACGYNHYQFYGAGLNIDSGDDVYIPVFTRINKYDLNDGTDVSAIPGDHKWVSIHAGYRTCIFIDTEGNAWSFGNSSSSDSLGLRSDQHRSVPTKITQYDLLTGDGITNIPPQHKWVSASISLGFSILIDSDGIAYGAGENGRKQLCIDDGVNKTVFSKIHKGVFAKVSCGFDHTLLLRHGGNVVSCGLSYSGQLGTLNVSDGIKELTFEYPVTDISALGYTSTFISQDMVFLCGANYNTSLLSKTPIVTSDGIKVPKIHCEGDLELGRAKYNTWDGGGRFISKTYTGCKIRYEPLTYSDAGSTEIGNHGQLCFDFNYKDGASVTPLTITSGGQINTSSIFSINQTGTGYHILDLKSSTSSFIWTSYNYTGHDHVPQFGRRGDNNLEAWVYRKSTKTHENTIFSINFDDSIVRTASGTVQASDDRLKLNERVISDANVLLKLRPQVYDKLTGLDGNAEDATFEAGLIAQEIWYDCPELRHLVSVGKDGDPADSIETSSDPTVDPDYSSWGPEPAAVNYVGFVPYLIRGFQEQHTLNESQKVEIFSLKKENETMKAQIAMLMKAVGLVDSGNVDSA